LATRALEHNIASLSCAPSGAGEQAGEVQTYLGGFAIGAI